MELYKKHRPRKLEDLIGQEDAVEVVKSFDRENMPHAVLLSGPSGCGKTTIARILRRRLKCSELDFVEMNAARERGIDVVREVQSRIGLRPVNGECRIWLIDEAHQLTGQAQESMLKMLEDTPEHVYFILATTRPEKLLRTIRTRCTPIAVKALTVKQMTTLLERVIDKEGLEIGEDVIERIVDLAGGSARAALVMLNQVARLPPEKQSDAILSADSERTAVDLAKELFNPRGKWSEVARILNSITEDEERVRRLVLSWASGTLLRGGKNIHRAALILDVFREPFYETGKPGLVMACYEIMHTERS